MSAESVPVRVPRVATEPSAPLTPVGETCLGIFAHLSGLFGIIGPFVVFCVVNERSTFARRQALEAINFQITYLLAIPVGLFFTALDPNWRSFGPIVVVLAAAFIFPIIGAANVGAGKHYRYPVAIRFIKVRQQETTPVLH